MYPRRSLVSNQQSHVQQYFRNLLLRTPVAATVHTPSSMPVSFTQLHRQLKPVVLAEIITIGIILLFVLPLETFVEPNHRLFRLDNPSIQFPFVANEQVPAWLLFTLVFIAPLAFILSVVTLSARHRRIAYASIVGFLTAFFFNVLVTDLLKQWVGNQRPDFLARCEPKANTPTDKHVGIEVCSTQNIGRLQEGYRSTPSGHSSTAFCGLFFLTFWLAEHFAVFTPMSPLYVSLASCTPGLLALYIAASRIIDYKHNWYDVVFGAALGVAIAYFVHSRICYTRDERDNNYEGNELGEVTNDSQV